MTARKTRQAWEPASAGRDAAEAFVSRHSVRFAHVDAAGIVFYPRYFELIDAAVEDWTEATFDVDRRRLHAELNLGLPTAELRAHFTRPSRLGDLLAVAIRVLMVRRASVRLSITVQCEAELRVSAELTLVLINLASMRSCAWPDAWRMALLAASKTTGGPA